MCKVCFTGLRVEQILSIGHFEVSGENEETFDEGPNAAHTTGDDADGDLDDPDGGISH